MARGSRAEDAGEQRVPAIAGQLRTLHVPGAMRDLVAGARVTRDVRFKGYPPC
jgi:hypothetical protein